MQTLIRKNHFSEFSKIQEILFYFGNQGKSSVIICSYTIRKQLKYLYFTRKAWFESQIQSAKEIQSLYYTIYTHKQLKHDEVFL